MPHPRLHALQREHGAVLAAFALLALGACSSNEPMLPEPPLVTTGETPAGHEPGRPGPRGNKKPSGEAMLALVEPARIRIHPLSRLERDDRGILRLTSHLELADAAGHSTKWLGRVRIELYRPAAAGAETGDSPALSGGETQAKFWEVDLTDPAQNALVYDDLVTRTYILPLVDLPEWVAKLQQGASREPWLTLRAYFITWDAGGRERILETSARIRRESGTR
ncbi:MAG: hypothetical protein ACT4PL_11680 [Phycisphaerales bacterium]